jgi:preprotein translocase subunit SecY
MNTFFEKVRLVFSDETLRRRILFTLGLLVATRLLSIIPIPGIDALRLESLLSGSEFLNLLNLFSGGGLANLSIVMLGVSPYITASIIMQLLTVMFPALKAMNQEEGDIGRKRFAQYTRMIAVPMGLVQGYAFIKLLQSQGVLAALSPDQLAVDILIILAGSMLLMWIGELITEFGVGNGVSLIIFAGIVTQLPATLSQLLFTYDPSQLPVYLLGVVISLLVIWGVVVVTEAERPIPITYAKQVRGGRTFGGVSTYLPLRINQAGVIPIIFALSILLFPQMIFQFLSGSSVAALASFSRTALSLLANNWFYTITYFFLVVLFTYFYTAVTFDPDNVSTNLQKSGAFIPGVRPGTATADYISRVLTRLTLVGALFLGVIAILPLVLRSITGIQSIAVGGTALLIVVSVIIDLVKKIDAQVSAREY